MIRVEKVSPWVIEFAELDPKDRRPYYEEAMKTVPQDIRKNLESGDFVFIGYIPALRMIAHKESKVCVVPFKQPGLMFKHKSSPTISIVRPKEIKKSVCDTLLGGYNKDVKTYLSWVSTYMKASPNERLRLTHNVFDGLKAYNDGSKESLEETEKGRALVEFFKSPEVQQIGASPSVEYFQDDLITDSQALFVHPFGGPVLTYLLKKTPIILLVSQTLRYDDSFLKNWNSELIKMDVIGLTD